MESSLLLHHGGLKHLSTMQKLDTRLRRPTHNPKPMPPYRVSAAMVEPVHPVKEKKTVYNDGWFDRLAIHHLSHSIQLTTGMKTETEGYDGMIEAASAVARNFEVEDQQELVIESLKKAFPRSILAMIRILTPPSKFTREFFAVFTTIFFPWLVGKCETEERIMACQWNKVRESEFQGRMEKNVVYIPKCRFLEGTNCVGMCTNLCKMPSQKFIKDSFGMPVYMKPNFEDMSCEMIFGQHPPEDDPAMKQPCYKKLCTAKQMHGVNCST